MRKKLEIKVTNIRRVPSAMKTVKSIM